MKRRYRQGHWIRIPLGGSHDVVALIARACRSRLFGYFFAAPAGWVPQQEELKALRADDAIAAMLFGGGPIEDGRWEILATSLAFDPAAWPFPDFALRGAFGQSWTRVRYDPETMQIAGRVRIAAGDAERLPDARFADERETEALLRRRLRGESPPRVQSVLELRSPIDSTLARDLEDGARLQFSTPLSPEDLAALEACVRAHPGIGLRVHGFRRGFDARALSRLRALRDLTIDVHALQHARAIGDLHDLRVLRLGAFAADLSFVAGLPHLRRLDLRGTRGAAHAAGRAPQLRELVLESTQAFDLPGAVWAPALGDLTLAHGEYDLHGIEALRSLQRLELRSLDARALPEFARLPALETLVLHDLRAVRDLAPAARAPRLRDLYIRAMPHLNVADFVPFAGCAGLRLHVDLGSRRKEREIYRLVRGVPTASTASS